MRQFATIQSIVDLQGYPVSGDRLLFLVDDKQFATITDKDGTEISNPVKIVNGHTEVQVFLPDVDVKIVQQTLVDADTDTWKPVSSWWDKAPVLHIDVEGGTPSVGTIADLRDLDPSVGSVNLLGYYSAGDKPMINYIWVSSHAGPINDDGLFIESNKSNRGYWKAVFGEDYVDLRHYGIFPGLGRDYDKSALIASAYDRVRSIGKNIYFCADTGIYYDISGCSIQGAKTDDGVVLYASTTDADLYDCGRVNVYADESTKDIYVYADTVYSSQNSNQSRKIHLSPRETLIFDQDDGLNAIYSNITVSLAVNVTKSTRFTNCDIIGSGKIDPDEDEQIALTRCRVGQANFADDCDFSLVNLIACESSISRWSSAAKYVTFCLENGDKVVDLNGGSYDGIIDIYGDITIKNANIGSLNITSGKVVLENVETMITTGNCTSINCYDSVISGGANITANGNCVINQSSIGCGFTTSGKLVATSSTFTKDIYFKSCNIIGCSLGGDVNINPANNVMADVSISTCIFADGKQIYVSSETGGVTANGVFVINNILNGTERPIIANRMKISSYVAYVESNNQNASTPPSSDVSNAYYSGFESIGTSRLLVRKGDDCFARILSLDQMELADDSAMLNPSNGTASTFGNGAFAVFTNLTGTSVENPVIGKTLPPGAVVLAIKLNGGWRVIDGLSS